MATVPIPFVDQDVDTDDDATSIGMTVGLVIIGFALFAWFQDVGGYVANQMNSYLSDLIGFDPTSGEDSGADLL
jgi:hypothetical protein